MSNFNVGDLIKAVSADGEELCGGSYTTYSKFFELYDDIRVFQSRYIDDEVQGVRNGSIYKIVAIKNHEYDDTKVYVVEDIQNTQIFLISNDYNEMVLCEN
jgi:hypothetical protein